MNLEIFGTNICDLFLFGINGQSSCDDKICKLGILFKIAKLFLEYFDILPLATFYVSLSFSLYFDIVGLP